jgi:hypothetical protein
MNVVEVLATNYLTQSQFGVDVRELLCGVQGLL